MPFYARHKDYLLGIEDIPLTQFKNELIVTPIPTSGWFVRQNWKLKDTLVYEKNGKKYEIEKGFISDLASIPIPFIFLLRPAGAFGIVYAPAAVLHDWALEHMPKDEADNLFKEALLDCGMSKTLANIYYYAVHSFSKGKK